METSGYSTSAPGEEWREVARTPLTVLFLLLVLAAAQFIYHYPRVPDVLATHFSVSGNPNAWSNKDSFLLAYGAVEIVIVAVAVLISRFASRIPTGALNIPNRDYWLAPERRVESLRFVWGQILWIEAATLAFLIVVAEVVFQSNAGPDTPTLMVRDLLVILIAFVAVTAWLSFRIITRFRLPRNQ